ncbi:glycosyl hydrolase [Bifidobacterium biavatii]|nr:glycosyl hydrolase [Bifidobacterium biavatii]
MAIPVDPNLTPRARALFDALHAHTGEFAMFGHQGDTFARHTADADSDTFAVTGAYPAVWGIDLGRIELGWDENIDHMPFDDIRRESRRAYEMGAIVTFSWHSVNPITEGGYGENLAPGSVAAVLPGGSHHDQYIGWLDRLADFLLSVRDANGEPIPVVFRPFHEHTGDWFWWCSGSPAQPTDTTPEQFASLWRMTVEYLRDARGVHHVLYAYSPDRSRIDMTDDATLEAGYLRGYPGDEYVDVLGLDDYWDIDRPLSGPEAADPHERHDKLVRILTLIGRLGEERGRLAAVTEVGSPREFAAAYGDDPNTPWTTFLLSAAKANRYTRRALWYLPWSNFAGAEDTGAYGTPTVDSPYAEDFRRFVRDDFMRMADTLPNMYA